MSSTYYPLAVGNSWTYTKKDGATYTNTITAGSGTSFTAHNSEMNKDTAIIVDGNNLLTDAYEAGTTQSFLKENAAPDDTWDITFTANGLKSILTMTVVATGETKSVDGKDYTDVLHLQAESKIDMNGTITPINFFTHYYYAKGVGLICTILMQGTTVLDTHVLSEIVVK